MLVRQYTPCKWYPSSVPLTFFPRRSNSGREHEPGSGGRVHLPLAGAGGSQSAGRVPALELHWMDEILHRFETMGDRCGSVFKDYTNSGISWVQDCVHPHQLLFQHLPLPIQSRIPEMR